MMCRIIILLAALLAAPAAPALAGPLTATFTATITGAVVPSDPEDPLGLGGGGIATGTPFSGTASIAGQGYTTIVNGQAQTYGFSDGVPGFITIGLNFAATYTQTDSSFNEILYASSAGDGMFDSVAFNANDYSVTGISTETIFHLTPTQSLTGQTLQTLVATPFTAYAGTVDFYEFYDGVLIGGFTAQIDMFAANGAAIPEPAPAALLWLPLLVLRRIKPRRAR